MRSPISRALAALGVATLLISACAGPDSPEGGPADPSASGDAGTEDSGLTEEERAEQERIQELTDAVEARDAALAGPQEDHREQAAELVSQMSVEQLAGQVLIGEYSGTDAAEAVSLIEELHLAGVILMGHNIPGGTHQVDRDALAEDLAALSAAGADDRAVAPMISVDQEGGLVTRVGSPLTEWSTPMAYGAAFLGSGAFGAADEEDTASDDDDGDSADISPGAGVDAPLAQADQLTLHGHRQMAGELAELGFTITFAPTADVTFGAQDPTIGSRSFGSDPDAVAALSYAAIRGLAEGGVAGSVKHFPGHGSVDEDSHVTLPVQSQSLEELRSRDWVPFEQAVAHGVPMVMMGHLQVPALDESAPSSLSAAAYQEIRDYGHEGVIVTDAMNMAAIVNSYGGDEAAVRALAAGADLLLMPSSVAGAHGALVDAVESGDLDEQRLIEAAERVVALGLWQQELAAGDLAGGPGVTMPEGWADHADGEEQPDWDGWSEDAQGTAHQLAQQSLTVIEGDCQMQVEAIQVVGGTERDRALMSQAAQNAGLEVGYGTVVTLLGGATPGSGDVVIALDRPEALAGSQASTRLAAYGRTQATFEVIADYLSGAVGEDDVTGVLPVDVGEAETGSSAC